MTDSRCPRWTVHQNCSRWRASGNGLTVRDRRVRQGEREPPARNRCVASATGRGGMRRCRRRCVFLRSNSLGDFSHVVREMHRPRFELGLQPWQGCVIPLHYRCVLRIREYCRDSLKPVTFERRQTTVVVRRLIAPDYHSRSTDRSLRPVCRSPSCAPAQKASSGAVQVCHSAPRR